MQFRRKFTVKTTTSVFFRPLLKTTQKGHKSPKAWPFEWRVRLRTKTFAQKCHLIEEKWEIFVWGFTSWNKRIIFGILFPKIFFNLRISLFAFFPHRISHGFCVFCFFCWILRRLECKQEFLTAFKNSAMPHRNLVRAVASAVDMNIDRISPFSDHDLAWLNGEGPSVLLSTSQRISPLRRSEWLLLQHTSTDVEHYTWWRRRGRVLRLANLNSWPIAELSNTNLLR